MHVAVHLELFNATATASQETEHVNIYLAKNYPFTRISPCSPVAAYSHGTRSVHNRSSSCYSHASFDDVAPLRTQTRLTQVKIKPAHHDMDKEMNCLGPHRGV
jgi:hypothetical protein